MSLLTVITNMATECGVKIPTTVVGNTDVEVVELLRASNKAGKYLTKRFDWQVLTKEKTFVSVATETQTNMIPTDFDRFLDETFWNRTRKLQFFGPMTPQEWQQVKIYSTSPITNSFRYRGSNILMSPVPTAGDTFAYEYISKNWCQTSGAVGQAQWAADTDTGVLDEYILELGGITFWKMQKGLAAESSMADFDTMVQLTIDADKPKRTIDMSAGSNMVRPPGVVVPDGSWLT